MKSSDTMINHKLLFKAKMVLETLKYQYFFSSNLSPLSAAIKIVYAMTIRNAFTIWNSDEKVWQRFIVCHFVTKMLMKWTWAGRGDEDKTVFSVNQHNNKWIIASTHRIICEHALETKLNFDSSNIMFCRTELFWELYFKLMSHMKWHNEREFKHPVQRQVFTYVHISTVEKQKTITEATEEESTVDGRRSTTLYI